MMRGSNGLQWVLRLHRGKILGAGVGFGVALLIMWFKWWSLVILGLMLLGGAIGAWLVDSQADVDLVDE